MKCVLEQSTIQIVFIGSLFLGLTAPNHCAAQSGTSVENEFEKLNWSKATGTVLPTSNAHLENLPGFAAVVGQDAVRSQTLIGNDGQNVEAYVVNPNTKVEAVFFYLKSGFIKTDDWSDLNPKDLIKQITEATEAGNIKRQQIGVSPLHVDGWVQVPTLNQDSHTVSWIISNHSDDGEHAVNAVALKLGRYGLERIVLIEAAAQATGANSDLLTLANAHRFPTGAQYTDYAPATDKAAEYGVAGLVAGVLESVQDHAEF